MRLEPTVITGSASKRLYGTPTVPISRKLTRYLSDAVCGRCGMRSVWYLWINTRKFLRFQILTGILAMTLHCHLGCIAYCAAFVQICIYKIRCK
jgi:hypothetical protein